VNIWELLKLIVIEWVRIVPRKLSIEVFAGQKVENLQYSHAGSKHKVEPNSL
jgi:hypothetical protein